jgi:hypothetical protein
MVLNFLLLTGDIVVSTERNRPRLSRQCESLSGGLHIQRLMLATVVVEADPLTDAAVRMLDAAEALEMEALLFLGVDHALDHAVCCGQGGVMNACFTAHSCGAGQCNVKW